MNRIRTYRLGKRLLSLKRVYKSGIRFCGETDITLDYGSRIQGSNPCRTATKN